MKYPPGIEDKRRREAAAPTAIIGVEDEESSVAADCWLCGFAAVVVVPADAVVEVSALGVVVVTVVVSALVVVVGTVVVAALVVVVGTVVVVALVVVVKTVVVAALVVVAAGAFFFGAAVVVVVVTQSGGSVIVPMLGSNLRASVGTTLQRWIKFSMSCW